MGRKILAISLVLVMALAFVACEGEGLPDLGESPTAQEIVDGAIEALAGISTYQFEADMTIDMASEAEGETFAGTVAADYSGALDLDNRRIKMYTTMNVAVTGEDEMEVETEMYLIDDMVYVMTDTPETGSMWIKSEVPAGFWEGVNQIVSQLEILEASPVEVIGSERVGGIDCYVLEVTPDVEQLWQIFLQQLGITGEMMLDFAPEFLSEMFRSYSTKHWIAKDSYFLMKVEIEMEMELTSEALGSPEEGEASVDMLITLLAYDYNQPVSIELPPEAEEAIEVPMPGF